MLSGRVALITGATRGFGLLITESYLAAGGRVIAVARSMSEELRALSQEYGAGRIRFVGGDIGTITACENAVAVATASFGAVDILINNAALGMNALASSGDRPRRFWQLPPNAYRRFFAVNSVAPFQLAQLVVGGMLDRGWGRIINLTTGLKTMQMAGYTPYGPTKAALEAASVAWASELFGRGVTVNVLIPGGPSRTRMISEDPSVCIAEADLIDASALVEPALWLASDGADGFTGRRLIASKWRRDLVAKDAAYAASEIAGW